MYKTAEQAKAFAEEFRKLYKPSDVRVAIAAPFTQLWALKEAFAGSGIAVAAQNMHWADEGAYTGEVSAAIHSFLRRSAIGSREDAMSQLNTSILYL